MSDILLRAIARDAGIQISAAVTTGLVERARQIHDTTPVATAALGRTLTATAIMGSQLKVEDGSVTVQVKGNGPLGAIVCVGDADGYVREDEDVFCVWQAAVEDSLCAYQFDIFAREGGKWTRAQETHEERIYTVEQLTDMLEKAGFSEIKTYGDQSFAPVRGGEDRIYFTARKRD